MNTVSNWIEHLQHPLVLAGFSLFLFTNLLKPLYSRKLSGTAVERLLGKGMNRLFILALLVILGGVTLSWREKRNIGEQTASAGVKQATHGQQSPAIIGKNVHVS